LFRIAVTSRDRKRVTVTFQVDDHPSEPRPYAIRQVADCLRIPRKEIKEILADWTSDDLVAHLSKFTADELKPPACRP